MAQSIHVIDPLQWISGPVRAVSAALQTARHPIVSDLAVARLSYEKGALGLLQSSTAIYPAFRSRLEVQGEYGSAIFNPEWHQLCFWDVQASEQETDRVIVHTQGCERPG